MDKLLSHTFSDFFIITIGAWVERHPKLLRRIVDRHRTGPGRIGPDFFERRPECFHHLVDGLVIYAFADGHAEDRVICPDVSLVFLVVAIDVFRNAGRGASRQLKEAGQLFFL